MKPEHRDHDKYCKTCIERQLCTSYAKYRRVHDSLTPIDPNWDTETPDAPDTSLLATRAAKDDGSLAGMLSAEFVHRALASLSVEHQLVISLHLGLGENARPIRDLRTLSRRSFVSEARLPGIIASATAKLQRWHMDSLKS